MLLLRLSAVCKHVSAAGYERAQNSASRPARATKSQKYKSWNHCTLLVIAVLSVAKLQRDHSEAFHTLLKFIAVEEELDLC